MKKSLTSYIENGEFISIYDDEGDLDSCACGIPLKLTDSELLLLQVDTNGWYDGYLSILLANIHRVDVKGKYEMKLRNLYNSLECNKSSQANLDRFEFRSLNLKESLFNLSLSKAALLKISIDQSNQSAGLIGEVTNMNEETIRFQLFDLYGQKDGVAEFYLSDVQKAYLDSIELRSIELLRAKGKT